MLTIKYLFIIIFFFTIHFHVYSKTDSLIIKVNSEKEKLDLSNLFRNYSFKPLIRNELLQTRENDKKFESNQIQSSLIELSKIFLLQFESDIPIYKLISILKKIDLIEYVEFYPKRNLCFIPNDSLFNQQYYMQLLRIPEAWDSVQVKKQVLVGIVDTGIDYDHPDLTDNIWINPGESGIDSEGKDKKNNGIDDDGNGFIDDWHGWDFMADSLGEDNDPFPGHGHGTHVGGTVGAVINNTIGIAGMCDSIKILPVKAGSDNPFSTSVRNTYEALLYAAKMGADVINCSWGGSSRSLAEQEVINAAISLGSTIIAAAGNDGEDAPLFPAAYEGVVSVASIDSSETKSFFSNYNGTVDVSAPGMDIISTLPWNSYAAWMGTSMASPIASGVAAMIIMTHPEYSPIQVGEHLKATCSDIYSKNSNYYGKLGKGRIDAFKAITEKKPKNILIRNINISNDANSDRFQSNSKCYISLELENVLTPLKNFRIFVRAIGNSDVEFNPSFLEVGEFKQFSKIKIEKGIEFKLPQINEFDQIFEIELSLLDSFDLINQMVTSITVNPSYLTFDNNSISTTFNSKGNIGFNDYPTNIQGVGFTFNGSSNILFEGSLMISSDTILADVARNSGQSMQNNGLIMHKNIEYLPLMNPSLLVGNAEIVDNPLIAFTPGIKINQTVHQQKTPNNAIFSVYDLINTKNTFQDSVYAGLYFDWDIGISGTDNQTYWNSELNSAIIQNVKIDSLPKVAVKMLSDFKNNYWAIDNDGTSEENPGVWDGFTEEEKIRMLKSNIGRDTSRITDVGIVLSAGPIFLDAYDTTRVCFVIVCDTTLEGLSKSLSLAEEYAKNSFLDKLENKRPITSDKITKVFPNPALRHEDITIFFEIFDFSNISIEIYDSIGKKIVTLIDDKKEKGKYAFQWNTQNFSTGIYFIKMVNGRDQSIYPLLISE